LNEDEQKLKGISNLLYDLLITYKNGDVSWRWRRKKYPNVYWSGGNSLLHFWRND